MPYNVLNGTEFTTKEVTQCLTSRGHAVRNLNLRPLSEQELCAALQGVDAVLASNEPYSERVFQAARGLKIVARAGAGYDAVDLKAATQSAWSHSQRRLGHSPEIGATWRRGH